VAPDDVDRVLEAARSREEGAHAAVIGAVEGGPPRVAARTGLGVTRPLILLAGDQLPRIC
jgi:hydrogenase maturation factor